MFFNTRKVLLLTATTTILFVAALKNDTTNINLRKSPAAGAVVSQQQQEEGRRNLSEEDDDRLKSSFECILTESVSEFATHISKFEHVCQGYDDFDELEYIYYIDDTIQDRIPDLSDVGLDVFHNSGRYNLILSNVIRNPQDNIVITTPETSYQLEDLWEEEEDDDDDEAEDDRKRKLQGKLKVRKRVMDVEGDQSILIVRISTNDSELEHSAQELSTSFFSMDIQSLRKRYSLCSFGKLNFIPATGHDLIVGGVLDLHLNLNIQNVNIHGGLLNKITRAVRLVVGDSLPVLYDHVVYNIPFGTTFGENGEMGWKAFAYTGAWLSVFNDKNILWLSYQNHEIGHNLGLQHSSHNANDYGDQSGIMGYGYEKKNSPEMCFNGAKSWQLGWYRQKALDVSSDNTSNLLPMGVYVDAFVDYETVPSGEYVLVRLFGNMHILYNKQKGMNVGTQEFQDCITITSMETTKDLSDVEAALSPTESYSFQTKDGKSNITIKFCEAIQEDGIDKAKLMIYDVSATLSNDPCDNFLQYSEKSQQQQQQQTTSLTTTRQPTPRPTRITRRPTPRPTRITRSPTPRPTRKPTSSSHTFHLTPQPTPQPTSRPTPNPTSSSPTLQPTPRPTPNPTTQSPTITLIPTSIPTEFPSISNFPTMTISPTWNPTKMECDRSNQLFVELTLKTDTNPDETSWVLRQYQPMEEDDSNNNSIVIVDSRSVGYYNESLKTHQYKYCIPNHQKYEFRITDEGADGIRSIEYGMGYYELKVNDKIEEEGGKFGRYAVTYFEGDECSPEFSNLNFRLNTGTNPQFVTWELASDRNSTGTNDNRKSPRLPLRGGPWIHPMFKGYHLEYQSGLSTIHLVLRNLRYMYLTVK